ncbi:hypothetical protein [Streptomyces sp. NPDC020965]|uniref:hypothetical protein n=1 Tax=Streptomyces sp. NPDC020965 TaxID=3365105 RepID=UPI0037B15431
MAALNASVEKAKERRGEHEGRGATVHDLPKRPAKKRTAAKKTARKKATTAKKTG